MEGKAVKSASSFDHFSGLKGVVSRLLEKTDWEREKNEKKWLADLNSSREASIYGTHF